MATFSGLTISGGVTLTPAGGPPPPPPEYGSTTLDGASQYLTIPNNSALSMQDQDFTIECWVYPITYPSIINTILYLDYGSSSNEGSLQVYGGNIAWQAAGTYRITGGALTSNAWSHIAVARSGGQTKMFVNGVQAGSTYTDPTYYLSGSNAIGAWPVGIFTWHGGVTNVRIVKGTALYTSNFTPPTTNLTAVSGTQLLLDMKTSGTFLTDGSTNNFTITNNGSATWSSATPY